MQQLAVEIDGKQEKVWVQRSKGVLWVHFRGRTLAIGEDEARGRKARGSAGSSHPGKIMAPMPGKVTKVAVSQGALVARGEPLVILEAMKMEYTLTADIDGRAAAVRCRAGDQVTLGQVLVQLEAGGEQ